MTPAVERPTDLIVDALVEVVAVVLARASRTSESLEPGRLPQAPGIRPPPV